MLPRLVGIAVPVLVFCLNVGVTVGAATILSIYQQMSLTVFFQICQAGLSHRSLVLTALMVVMQAIHVILV